MATINNRYRNQYRVALVLKGKFDQFWNNSGVKNDSIKGVMEAIFNLLEEDLRKTVDDNDYNQTLLDREEFQDLMKLISSALDEYTKIEESDIKETTEQVRVKLNNLINENIKKVLEQIKSEKKLPNIDEKEVYQKLDEVIRNFIQNNKSEAISHKHNNGDISNDILDKFEKKLTSKNNYTHYSIINIWNQIKTNSEFKNATKNITNTIERLHIGLNNKQNNKSNEIKNRGIDDLSTKRETVGDTLGIFVSKAFKISTLPRIQLKLENVLNSFGLSLINNKSDKTNIFSKISKSFDKFKGIIGNIAKRITNVFGVVFKPFKKYLGKILNGIRHPLSTLNKFFGKSWVKKILTAFFISPGGMFFLGFIAGKIWRKISDIMLKYVTIPIYETRLKFEKWRTKKENEIDKITDENDDEGKFELFKQRDGLGIVESLLINLATLTGYGDIKGIRTIFSVGGGIINRVFNSMINIMASGNYPLYRGTNFLGKLIMLISHTQSESLGTIFNKDKDDYTFAVRDKFRTTSDKFEEDINKARIDEQQANKLREIREMMESETIRIDTLRMRNKENEDIFSLDEVADFLKSDAFPDKEQVKKRYSQLYADSFEEKGAENLTAIERQRHVIDKLLKERVGIVEKYQSLTSDEHIIKLTAQMFQDIDNVEGNIGKIVDRISSNDTIQEALKENAVKPVGTRDEYIARESQRIAREEVSSQLAEEKLSTNDRARMRQERLKKEGRATSSRARYGTNDRARMQQENRVRQRVSGDVARSFDQKQQNYVESLERLMDNGTQSKQPQPQYTTPQVPPAAIPPPDSGINLEFSKSYIPQSYRELFYGQSMLDYIYGIKKSDDELFERMSTQLSGFQNLVNECIDISANQTLIINNSEKVSDFNRGN